MFDFVTLGELFQNNHHKFGMSPNFAARWFEIDPTWVLMQPLIWLGIIELAGSKKAPSEPVSSPSVERAA